MYLSPGVPRFDPSVGQSIFQNIMSAPTALPMAQAQLSQQQTQAQFAPQAAQASINRDLAMANMYGGRGNYYNAGAGLNDTKSNVLATGGNNQIAQLQRVQQYALLTGDLQTAQDASVAMSRMSMFGGNTPANTPIGTAFASGAAAQNSSNPVNASGITPGQIAATSLTAQQAEANKNQGEAAKAVAGSVMQGSPYGYVSPQTGITPGMISPSAPASVSPTTGLTPQGNSPGTMQSLQTQLNNLSPQGSAPSTIGNGSTLGMQPISSYQDSDIQKLAMQGSSTPPPVQGAREKPPAFILNSANSFGSAIKNLDTLYESTNTPGLGDMMGKNISGYGSRALGATEGFFNVNNPAYSAYQAVSKSVPTTAEAIGKAMTGSNAFKAYAPFISAMNPDAYPTVQAYQNGLQQQAVDLANKLTTQLRNNYDPATRTTLWNSLQQVVNSKTYQAAQQNNMLNGSGAQVQTQGASAPQPVNGNYTFGGKVVPESVISQYAQQNNITPQQAATYLQQNMGQ